MAKKLVKNSVKCLTCNKILESKHRHDFVTCDCPPDSSTEIFIDGGLSYLRMGAGTSARWENLCQYEELS